MEKVLACKDVEEGCNFEVRGKTDDEILEKYFKHMRERA